MYNKIYINVSWLEKPKELEKYAFLFKEKDIKKIWNFSMKVGQNNKGKIYDVAVLEILLLFCFLRNKGYKENQIEILYNKSMFIFNEDLYKIENGISEKLLTDKVGFYSIRAGDWNFPFFYILKRIINKKKGHFKRTNNINNYLYGKGKLYTLYHLYDKRKEVLGDLIIPYKIKEKHLEIFKDFLKNNFSNTLVIKKDFACAGNGVYVIDLNNYDNFQKNKFQKAINNNDNFTQTSYISPYYKFKREYRFYFTKNNKGIKIHSFKEKKIISSLKEIIKCDSFRYYKNVQLKWLYIENKEHKKYKDIFDFAYKNIKLLPLSTGTFEFGETYDNKKIFFEVNPMSATVCFEGEDENNMKLYYDEVFEELLKKTGQN